MSDTEWELDEAAADDWASGDVVEVSVVGAVLMAIVRIFVR